VSPSFSPALGGVPCAAMWYDARSIGRPIHRGFTQAVFHDGWRTCPALGTELISVEGIPRLVCPDHARQTRAAAAAGLTGQLRWRQ
jgi:hypothetical protein